MYFLAEILKIIYPPCCVDYRRCNEEIVVPKHAVIYQYGLRISSHLSQVAKNPGLYLNPQDVPIFYDNSPLEKLDAFTIVTSFAVNNSELQQKLKKTIATHLDKFADVVHLKENDVRGFGVGNVFLLQIGEIKALQATRISLSIDTPVTVNKTGVHTFPMIWSINDFLHQSPNKVGEEILLNAVTSLVSEFFKNHEYTNPSKRPTFYIYD